jgi:predicted dehydrogenase
VQSFARVCYRRRASIVHAGVSAVANHSRRDFIAGSVALAALPGLAMSKSRAPARRDKPLGVALCGLGSLATEQIAPALQRTKNCRLAGVVSGSPEKGEAWRAKYDLPGKGIYTYDTMHTMADNPDIDIVYIVTPNALHLEQATIAARAGKHVFCEKPLEISVERCQQMIDVVKAAGRRLGVAYRCQYDPNHIECARIARERELGDLRIIQAGFAFSMGDSDQWRLQRELSGGGALMDIGIYCVQTLRDLTGEEPIWVSAVEAKTDPVKFAEVDETILWQSRFPSGVVANCTASYGANGFSNFRAGTTKGWFELDPAYHYTGNRGRRSDGREIALPFEDLFALELDDFADCIVSGKPSRVAGELGLQDVRIMMAIYESVRSGKPVTLGA